MLAPKGASLRPYIDRATPLIYERTFWRFYFLEFPKEEIASLGIRLEVRRKTLKTFVKSRAMRK